MFYVVPQVVAVFQQSRQTLPWLTQALIAFSAFMRATWMWWALGIVSALVALAFGWRSNGIRSRIQSALLGTAGNGQLLYWLSSWRVSSKLSHPAAPRA